MKKKTSWILPAVFALLVLVVMILIYYFSSENGLQSTATSNGVTKWVVKIIKPDFDSMEKADKAAYFSQVAHYVRKAAHFSEYFLLGLFSSHVALRFPTGVLAGITHGSRREIKALRLFGDGLSISSHSGLSSFNDQTRRLFGGRHPLCGIGVTSLIMVTSRPAVCSARMAASRPAPGPLT